MKQNKLLKPLLAVLLLALLPQAAAAYDFMVGGLCYNRNSGGTSVTVTYQTSSVNSPWYSNLTGDLVIPATVAYSGTTYSVTSIGNCAFYGCSGLTSVTIPNSVTSIGSGAFYNCSGLTSVTIGNSVTSIGGMAFQGCSGLTAVTIPNSVTSIDVSAFSDCSGLTGKLTIPNSVTSIGNYAFSGCSGLTAVTISNSVTSIGSSVFKGCSGLTSLTIPNSVTSIGGSAFQGCSGLTAVTIPNSVTSIGGSAFSDCSGLTGKLTIPNSVTSIGNYAFSGCSGLTSVTIGNSVTSIGSSAFSGCSGLTSVTIPNSVTSIGNYAFSSCSGLTSVTIPNSVTSIGGSAFSGCSGLTSVTIPNSVTSIGDGAFRGCRGLESMVVEAGNTKYDSRDNSNAIIETTTNTLIAGCKNTIIPNSVTSIGGSAFQGCSGLTSVTIPNSVTSIGSSAFQGCSGLTSVTIPNSVTAIGDWAFSHCSGLTSVTIPNSITTIGEYAFYSCSGLTSVTIPNSVTSIGRCAFAYCSGLTSVTIGNSVTSIETGAFSVCSGLTSVTIPNSVTSIGISAFSGCSGLTSVTIPNSVTSIGNYTFQNCSGLNLIHSEISDPANVQLGSTVFYRVPKSTCVLVVPAASLESYQSTSQWNEFTNIFAEMTSLDISEQSFELMRGKKQAIDVMTQPDNAWNQFVWTSSDNSVATVDEIGTVTAVSPGTATITAKYIFDSNLSDSCLVRVIHSCDVNDDDKVDIADVSLLINKMLEKNGALSMEYTDINGDGIVDIFDINEVISVMLGNGNLPELPTRTQTYTVNGVSFTMIGVEGCTFTMGATAEQEGDAGSYEKPAHLVTLSSYSIGQTEVTQELWQAVMGSNPSLFTGDLQRPVECVSWDDCQTFITKLNQLTGKNFRLPTEAEWEYAARGGNQSQGYKYAGSDNVDEVAWCWANIPSQSSGTAGYGTQTVATKAPNELGLYDMSGNVWEWCQDWYGSYSSDAQTNPTGPTSGSYRVNRGGSWGRDAWYCRVSGRNSYTPSSAGNLLGLRLAL